MTLPPSSTRVVEDLAGVVASATSVRRGRTVVTYDPTRSTVAEIAAAIVTAGSYEADLVEGSPSSPPR